MKLIVLGVASSLPSSLGKWQSLVFYGLVSHSAREEGKAHHHIKWFTVGSSLLGVPVAICLTGLSVVL